ncbi:MAG: carboxypeptidase regulatory-like domain-containing protein, partial [Calditrichaeota bacterium]|nr:carboxypeptidase regulatory-like domain-containing protein [Calditrichota bacterium]
NLGGKILGTVTKEEDGTPLEGAHVMAMLVVQPHFKLHAITGPDGSYEIEGVPTGTYKAAAVKRGYALEWYQDAATEREATDFRVEAPEEVTGIDFTLATRSAGYDRRRAHWRAAPSRARLCESSVGHSRTAPGGFLRQDGFLGPLHFARASRDVRCGRCSPGTSARFLPAETGSAPG